MICASSLINQSKLSRDEKIKVEASYDEYENTICEIIHQRLVKAENKAQYIYANNILEGPYY